MIQNTLVILSPGFPRFETETNCLPTVQQFVLSIKNSYPKIKIVVFAFNYPFYKTEYTWNGIDVIALGGKNKPGVWRFFNLVKAYKKLNCIYKAQGSLWVLSFWLTECSLVAKFFCERKNLKYFMWLQGQDAKKQNQYIKRIKPNPNKLIAISDFIQEEFSKNYNFKPEHVIENGINPLIFKDLNTSTRDIDILGVGSLTANKNYKFFVEIVYELRKTYPAIKTLIAGEGEQKKELQDLINKLDLSKNIVLIGFKAHEEILTLMSNTKLFLHTSVFEGTPAVVMEALYSGCFTFGTQKLANRKTENHFVYTNKIDFVAAMNLCLSKPLNYRRVLANAMDESAKKMIDLFLSTTKNA